MRDALREIGGGNISAGIRTVASQPHQSPSGAAWVTTPSQLPDPATCTGPGVMATPAGVVAHGIAAGSIVIDCEADELSILVPDGGVSTRISMADLGLLAGRLPAAILATLTPEPINEFGHDLPCGLHLTGLGHGLVEISAQGAGHHSPAAAVALPLRLALQLAAETLGLLSRRVEHHSLTVQELNSRLAGSQPAVQEAKP
jgi:hypothetical protein